MLGNYLAQILICIDLEKQYKMNFNVDDKSKKK